MSDEPFPMSVNVLVMNASQLRMVYAVLAGSLGANLIPGSHVELLAPSNLVPMGNVGSGTSAALNTEASNEAATSAPDVISAQGATVVPGLIDAHGHPWSAELHASTKAQTGAGLWRMKPGASRPEPKPGFPKADGATGTVTTGAASSPSATVATPAVDDEDEFAAFRTAVEKSNAGDAAAVAAVPARKWTDADVGALCNQAAQKLGTAEPVKAIIADFVPEGAVPHSCGVCLFVHRRAAHGNGGSSADSHSDPHVGQEPGTGRRRYRGYCRGHRPFAVVTRRLVRAGRHAAAEG